MCCMRVWNMPVFDENGFVIIFVWNWVLLRLNVFVHVIVPAKFCRAAYSFILFVEGKIWFSSCCLILGLGPLTKDTLWMEKQLRDEKPQAHSIVNTVKTLPQNNNNNASVCIPHTLLVCFLICLISVVVVCPPGLNYHFKQYWESFKHLADPCVRNVHTRPCLGSKKKWNISGEILYPTTKSCHPSDQSYWCFVERLFWALNEMFNLTVVSQQKQEFVTLWVCI